MGQFVPQASLTGIISKKFLQNVFTHTGVAESRLATTPNK